MVLLVKFVQLRSLLAIADAIKPFTAATANHTLGLLKYMYLHTFINWRLLAVWLFSVLNGPIVSTNLKEILLLNHLGQYYLEALGYALNLKCQRSVALWDRQCA